MHEAIVRLRVTQAKDIEAGVLASFLASLLASVLISFLASFLLSFLASFLASFASLVVASHPEDARQHHALPNHPSQDAL